MTDNAFKNTNWPLLLCVAQQNVEHFLAAEILPCTALTLSDSALKRTLSYRIQLQSVS